MDDARRKLLFDEVLQTLDMQGHLSGVAAGSAAMELMHSWIDVIQDDYETGPDALTQMMIADIDETIRCLAEWRRKLCIPRQKAASLP